MTFDQYRQVPEAFRGQYQPKKRNYTGWIIGCCVVPTLIGIGLAGYGAYRVSRVISGQDSFAAGILPKAGVQVGSQLAWQEPLGRKMNMSMTMTCGDFDGNGSSEALLIGMNTPSVSSMLKQINNPNQQNMPYRITTVQADGTVSSVGSNTAIYFPPTYSWDFRNDGVDDIVDSWGGNSIVEIFDPQLNRLTSLPGGSYKGGRFADMDGDGVRELVLADATNTSMKVYDSSGTEVASFSLGQNESEWIWADWDGDGTDELVIRDTSGGGGHFILRRNGQPDETMSGGWSYDGSPVLAHDVDGDGRDEVFASHYGFYNPASGYFTTFSYPAGYSPGDPSRMVYPVDIDGDGVEEFATGGNNYSMDSALFIFDNTGICIYYEEFGAEVQGKAVIRDSSGRQHIVVLCDNRLMLYP